LLIRFKSVLSAVFLVTLSIISIGVLLYIPWALDVNKQTLVLGGVNISRGGINLPVSFFHNSVRLSNSLIFLIGIIILAFFAFFLNRFCKRNNTKKRYQIFVWIINVLGFLFALFCLHFSMLSRSKAEVAYNSDVGNVILDSDSFQGQVYSEDGVFHNSEYLIQNSNNIFLAWLKVVINNISNSLGIEQVYGALYFNEILAVVAIICIWFSVQKIMGMFCGFISILFSIAFISFNSHTVAFYSDLPALSSTAVMLVISIYIINFVNNDKFSTLRNWKLWFLVVVFNILWFLGYIFKPTMLFFGFATILTIIIFSHKKRLLKNLLVCGILLVLFFIPVVAYNSVINSGKILAVSSERLSNATPPASDFINMGTSGDDSKDVGGRGSYNSMVRSRDNNRNTKEAMNNADISDIKTTLSNRDFMQNFHFFFGKLTYTFSRGDFHTYDDWQVHQSPNSDYINNAKITKEFREITVFNGLSQLIKIQNSAWGCCLILILLQIIFSIIIKLDRNKKIFNKKIRKVYLSPIRFLGYAVLAQMIIYQFFSESRPRYLWMEVPIFIFLSLFSVGSIKALFKIELKR
jgi:hypothetical protein